MAIALTRRRAVAKPIRRLFLDDDPARAEVFLARFPDADWVQTVPECVAKLAEAWDEVHLDHDLGGEHYVDEARDDCGMEVVRWLGREFRDYLRSARFTVHSHNELAAFVMVLRLREAGFRVEARPFGVEMIEIEGRPPRPWQRARDWLRRLRGLPPESTPAIDLDPDSPDWLP